MTDSSCWSMLHSCLANDKATEEFSTLVSPFKILLNPKILNAFKQIYSSTGWSG